MTWPRPLETGVVVEEQLHFEPPPRLVGRGHRHAGEWSTGSVGQLESGLFAVLAILDFKVAVNEVGISATVDRCRLQELGRRHREVIQIAEVDILNRAARGFDGSVRLLARLCGLLDEIVKRNEE